MKKELMIKMGAVMEDALKEFFTIVECEHKIPKDTLWRKWNSEDHEKIVDGGAVAAISNIIVKKDSKKSDYQTFFSIQRNKMVEENPKITFGEISKQVSAMWKKLTPEEKLRYSDIPKTASQSLEDLRREYMKISTTDLKNMCKEKGITGKFRKKEEFVGALVNLEGNNVISSVSLKPDEIMTKGRSKLELSAEDKEDEEEDFYFQDDGSSTSGESRAYDEDDTGILISEDDNDIFSDDD